MYNFDEGAFELPPEWNDRSVHVFERKIAGAALAMAITRETAEASVTVEAAADIFLGAIEPRLRRFELVSRAADRTLEVPAVRIRYHFFNEQFGQASSVQLMMRYEQRVLTVAMTGPVRVEAEMLKSFDGIVRTLKLRRRLT